MRRQRSGGGPLVAYRRGMTAYDRTERVPTPRPGARTGPRTGGPAGARSGGPGFEQRIGPYRLIEEIGEGGMGVVHLALDPRGRAVAIKVLRAHVAHDADARQRLSREVDTLSRIRDARVASVIDADVMAPRPYIVTRYVPGPALDEIVEERGPLAPADLLRLARGIAEAIRSIHACGVVHRDIKPGNVLIEDGEPVLIDFGIAHLQDDVRHTVGGLVMGTPGYLSPELVEGAAITDATDWWGWAATIRMPRRDDRLRPRPDGRRPHPRPGRRRRPRRGRPAPRAAPSRVALTGPEAASARRRGDRCPRALRRRKGRDGPDAERRPLGRRPVGRPGCLGRGPGRHPGRPGRQHGGHAAPPAPVRAARRAPDGAPRGRHGGAVGPAPTGPRAPAPDLTAYDHEDVDDGPGGGYWPEEEWDEDEPAPREGDPRIGLPMRTGLLAAVSAAWIGALMAWPGIALVALVTLSALARATDRSVTALVLRRYDFGRRRSDVPFAVVSSPWHLVVGTIATVVGLLLPVAVALAGVFATALLLAGTQGTGLGPGAPITLAVGGVLGLLMLWWGPGGASLRRGSRSMVRRLVPVGLASQIVGGLFVVLGLVAALVALRHGASLTWKPFSGSPFGP